VRAIERILDFRFRGMAEAVKDRGGDVFGVHDVVLRIGGLIV
jgi:hypothetical protein